MADFTEEELNKAMGGDETPADGDIAADLKDDDETKPADSPADSNPDEPKGDEPKDEDTPDGNEPKDDDPKGDDANPDDKKPGDDTPDEDKKPADGNPDPAPEPLILGKFKNQDALIKAYQDLEKQYTAKAQEVKQVEQVTNDEFDTAVRQKIAEETQKLVDKAFDTITNPDDAKEAQFLLMQFRKTGDGSYLEKARGYLDARVDRRLEVDAMNTAAKIQQTANEHRQEILLKPLAVELDKMAEEDPEFMNDEQNQNLMAMAIKLNPSTVDVRAVKKAIQDYSKTQYQKGYDAAKREIAKQVEKKIVPIKSVSKVDQPAPKKNIDDLSIKEQLEEEYKDIPSIF